MSAITIKELLCEVHPNLEITQIIKAADQLYYKDKTLYTDIRPEFIYVADGGKKTEISKKEQQKMQQENRREKKPSEGKAEIQKQTQKGDFHQQNKQKKKKENKDKKHNKGNVTFHESVKVGNVVENSKSKLEQVIEQAKKTVEQALNFGISNGELATATGVSNVEEELARTKAENIELRKRLSKLEKIIEKLLSSSGKTESDFSD